MYVYVCICIKDYITICTLCLVQYECLLYFRVLYSQYYMFHRMILCCCDVHLICLKHVVLYIISLKSTYFLFQSTSVQMQFIALHVLISYHYFLSRLVLQLVYSALYYVIMVIPVCSRIKITKQPCFEVSLQEVIDPQYFILTHDGSMFLDVFSRCIKTRWICFGNVGKYIHGS